MIKTMGDVIFQLSESVIRRNFPLSLKPDLLKLHVFLGVLECPAVCCRAGAVTHPIQKNQSQSDRGGKERHEFFEIHLDQHRSCQE